jgi:hypothetical protein
MFRGYNGVPPLEGWRHILSLASGGAGLSVGVPSRFAAELTESRSMLEQELAQPVFSFAYPRGWHSAKARGLVRQCGYLSARSGDNGYNLPGTNDMYALKTQVWHRFIKPGSADGWVDRAVERGAWLIETHHLVAEVDSSSYLYFTVPEALVRHLDYAAGRCVWIETQQQVARYLEARQHARLVATVGTDGRLRLSVTHGLDPAWFNIPLTVQVRWPGGQTLLEAVPDGREVVWQP